MWKELNMDFFDGLILGFTLQLSIGPVFIAVLHHSITRGSIEAIKMVFGVALVDFCYILLSAGVVANLIQLPSVNHIFTIIAAIGLILFGISYIVTGLRKKNSDIGEKEKNVCNSFLYGIKLTSINPLTIVLWASTLGALLSLKKISGLINIALTILGCVSATIIFLGAVSIAGGRIKKHLNIKLVQHLDIGAGAILIAFGITIISGFN